MGFDASSAVVALDYDFSEYVEDAKGTIPEPTSDGFQRYFARLQEAVTGLGLADLGDDPGPEQIGRALAALGDDAFAKISETMLDATAELCQGSPTRDQIEALPYRIRQAFFGWLQGQLADPTQFNAATRRSQAVANGAGPTTQHAGS
jgi:hypothetical protein